jgi:flagellar hook-length control protein FliK
VSSAATTDTATRSAGATPSAPSAADADASSSALGSSFSAQIQADTSGSTPGSSVPAKAGGIAPTTALFASGAAASAVAAEATADAGAAIAPPQIGAFAALLGVADKRGRDSAIDTVDAAGAAGGSAAGGSTAADGAAAALQANASQSSPTVSATMTDGLAKIDAGINTPEFSQALADRVSWMAGNNLNGATLQVNPPQLGPIELRVSVENGHAQVWLSAHSAATLDALQSSTPKLREMLSSQGFAQVSVDVSQRSFQDRSPYPQNSQWTPSSEDDAAAATSAVSAAASPRAALGMVDAYA